MRTTLNLDDDLALAAKARALAEGRTLTSLIEEALRGVLAAPAPRAEQVTLVTFGGDGAAPGVDLADPRALRDLAHDEETATYRAVGGRAAP